VTTYQAQLRVSGRVAGRRIPGLTVGLALDASGRIGMEFRVGGPPMLNLAGSADRATLLLHEQGRVVTAPAADIVEALVGARLGPARLLALLTGCVSSDPTLTEAGVADDLVVVTTPDAVVYLARTEREGQGERAWRVRAGEFEGLLADYRPFESTWPSEIDVRSDTGRSPRVALALRVVEFDVNSPRFNPAVFSVVVPDRAVATSLDELRDSGPLGSGR
jgi:hypothetical protein